VKEWVYINYCFLKSEKQPVPVLPPSYFEFANINFSIQYRKYRIWFLDDYCVENVAGRKR